MTDLFKTNLRDDGKLQDAAGDASITINARRFNRRLLIFLLAVEVFLVILDVTVNYEAWISVPGIRRMANIAREDGIATWFMAVQTLFAGVTVFLIYLVNRSREAPRRERLSWLFLSGFFVFMAFDDAAQIHERLGSAFEYYAETGAGLLGRLIGNFPSYAWQLFILPFFAAAGIFMFVFLWTRLKDNTGRIKLILAIDFFVFAIFLDFVEGLEPDSNINIFMKLVDNTALSEDLVYHFAKVVEESLEMLAITLLLSTFFLHLARSASSLRFRFDTGDGG